MIEFNVPEELFKNMIQRIPSIHKIRVLKQFKIKIPPEVSFKDYPKYLFTKLNESTKKKMFDEYGSTLPRTSIFLFKPNRTLFRNITDVYDLVDSLGLSDYLGKYHKIERLTKPILRSIYIDHTHSSLRLLFTAPGKSIRVVTPDGRLTRYYEVVDSVVTFWAQNNFVDVRVRGNRALARRILDEARVILKMHNFPFAPVRFNDLFFIQNVLNWVDIVGYITLEFRGVEIGKLSYSAPRKGRMPAHDLMKIRRVRKDIEDAFKKGGIRIMNGYITKNDGEKISFGLNFGMGKIRMLAFSSETDHNLIFSNLVKLSERGIPERAISKQRILMDFTSNQRAGVRI